MAYPKIIETIAKHNKKVKKTDRVLIVSLLIGSIAVFLGFSYLFWSQFSQKGVHYFLPKDETIGYLETRDLKKWKDVNPKLSPDFILNQINEWEHLPIKNIETDLSKDYIGIAFLKTNKASSPVFFGKVRHQQKVIENLNKIDGESIYTHPTEKNIYVTFSGPYLFLSNQKEPLEIIKRSQRTRNFLVNDDDFKKNNQALPYFAWANGFINLKKINLDLIPEHRQYLAPVQNMVHQLTFSLKKEGKGIKINTFSTLDPTFFKTSPKKKKATSQPHELAAILPAKETLFYVGGENLEEEWQNTLKTVSQHNPAYGIILEGLIRAQFSRLFGREVDLRNDLYPLLSDAYAFSIESSSINADKGFKLILKHKNADFVRSKLEKLRKGFRFLAAQFSPRLKTVVLPDGTESKEYYADTSRIIEKNEIYEGREISCIEITENIYGFCYFITDELLVITNTFDRTKDTIDHLNQNKKSLVDDRDFEKVMRNISKAGKEITFIRPSKLIEKNEDESPYWIDVLKSIDSIGWIKHQYKNGLKTEGYLILE